MSKDDNKLETKKHGCVLTQTKANLNGQQMAILTFVL